MCVSAHNIKTCRLFINLQAKIFFVFVYLATFIFIS